MTKSEEKSKFVGVEGEDSANFLPTASNDQVAGISKQTKDAIIGKHGVVHAADEREPSAERDSKGNIVMGIPGVTVKAVEPPKAKQEEFKDVKHPLEQYHYNANPPKNEDDEYPSLHEDW